jgi:hypothetical protein
MLNVRLLMPKSLVSASVLAVAAMVAPAAAQDFAPHRAVYAVTALDRGKPGADSSGTYAYELRLTCDGYVVNQRLRLETAGARGTGASEQQSQMTESRDGKKLRFEHRTTSGGRQVSLIKGEASLGDDGSGEARFTDPEGQTVALPAGTLFPTAIARETIRQAKAGESGFDALFFYGEKVKPPQSVNIVIGKVPRRLADVKVPDGAESLADGRSLIYYRAGFFDAGAKGQGEPAFEMNSITLDNGIELYGTHEESDGGIEYRITRLEALPKPECK